MSNVQELSSAFDAFKEGRPEAFRYYCHLHNYRIYCYLLQVSRDREQAKQLAQNVFIVVFHHVELVSDEDQLLRRLYLAAKAGYILWARGLRFLIDLEEELTGDKYDDATIMEDPDVARNETLASIQVAIQKLPLAKREVAELYFFQGFSISAIGRLLGIDEEIVKEYISQTLVRLGDALSGKEEKGNFPVVMA